MVGATLTSLHITIYDICRIKKLALKTWSLHIFSESNCFMNLFKKIEWGFTVLAMAPLVELEKKEREKKLEEWFKRLEQKHKNI